MPLNADNLLAILHVDITFASDNSRDIPKLCYLVLNTEFNFFIEQFHGSVFSFTPRSSCASEFFILSPL
jgi:hypothetical protein